MISRLPLRLAVPLLILVTGMLILVSAWFFESRALYANGLKSGETQLRSTASFVAAEVEAALRNADTAEARAAIERASANPLIQHLYVVSPDGTIRFTSDPLLLAKSIDEIPMTQTPYRIIEQAQAQGSGRVEVLDDSGRLAGAFPLLMRLSPDDLVPSRIGALYVVFDVSNDLARQQAALTSRMARWGAILALIALGFWALLRRLLLKRIDALVHSVRAVGKGDFDQHVEISGHDELADLGREFDGMAQRLRSHSAQLSYLARHDELTELLSRRGFEGELDRYLSTRQPGDESMVLCLLDIDSLRVVNDTLGHQAGDEFLQSFAELVGNALPLTRAAARVGGDEFGLMVELQAGDSLDDLAIGLQREVGEFRFESGGERFGVQASIGLVKLDDDAECSEDALGCADAACYMAKETNRGSYHIGSFDLFSSEQLRGEMRWVSRIQNALDNDRFCLFAQPIKAVSSMDADGLRLEILVRMIDDHGKILPPAEFLKAAERYNLVGRIDHWVVRHTLDFLARDTETTQGVASCSINLSGASLGDEKLISHISKWLEDHPNIPASKLCFEVTETAAIGNLNHARSFVDRLRALGCRFALDDFGTGLSSFAYIKRLPVDLVKIDGIFVRDMLKDPVDRAIVRAINEIAHEVGMQTVAEFVENQATLDLLRELGVDYAQGYGIARPAPLEDTLAAYLLPSRRANG